MTSAQSLSVPAPRTGCPLDPPPGYRVATEAAPVSAANRDEEAFPGGSELDVTRDARGQMAFG